jgi:hypothetical protein
MFPDASDGSQKWLGESASRQTGLLLCEKKGTPPMRQVLSPRSAGCQNCKVDPRFHTLQAIRAPKEAARCESDVISTLWTID